MANQIGELDPGLYQPLPAPADQPSAGDAAPIATPAPPSSSSSDGVDPQLLQQLMTQTAAPTDQSSGGVDPVLLKQLNDATAPGATPSSSPSGNHPGGVPPPRRPTRFQQATTPPHHAPGAPAAAPEPELSWGQVAQQGLQNLLPSLGGVANSLGTAITHPVQTAQGIVNLGQGLASQAAGRLGAQQDPVEKAKAEATANALEQHFGAYGSVKSFKKMLATDPASVAMDASMFIDPAAGALGKLGETGRLGALSDAATTASKVLPYANPVTSALALAKAPGAVASWAGRGLGSVTSRVPLSALKLATQIGQDGDPIAQAAFTRFASGQGDATEIQQLAQQKLAQIRQASSDQYLADKSNLADTNPSFSPIDQAIADARSKIQMGGPEFQQAANQFPEANKAVDAAESMVNAYRNSPDPVHGSLYGVDNLKQALYDIADNYAPGSTANSSIMGIYHGAKQALVDADPDYANLMDNYQVARQNINDLTKTLGLGKNAAATGLLTKSLRALKSGTGSNLLEQLMEGNPELRGALTGAAINPWSQHGSVWEAALGAGLPGMVAHPLAAAGIIPGAIAGWAASSPRVVGSMANMAGQMGAKLDALGSPVANAATKGAYYAGRVQQQDQSSPQAGVSGGSAVPASSAEATFNKMLQIESGNKQTYKNGQPVISPKGAVGIAQVMPQTGPEAAALAGEAWDPERLKTDADYNLKLGKAYYNHLVQMFGDPSLAAAAYNGGPGRVQRALQLAAQNGDSWTKYLAPETQNYVRNTASANGGRITRASGGRTARTKEQLVQRLLTLAKSAKQASNEATKPLLKVPDNTVAKALEVAKAAI